MLKQNPCFVVLKAEGLNIPELCVSPEFPDLGDDNKGFSPGQQVLTAGM